MRELRSKGNKEKQPMAWDVKWQEITPGGTIYEAGNSEGFKTGDWRSMRPVWLESKCKQCMICPPTCPDNAIPVQESKRMDFDYDFCKGCGVCVKACPFNAIDFIKEGGEEDRKWQ